MWTSCQGTRVWIRLWKRQRDLPAGHKHLSVPSVYSKSKKVTFFFLLLLPAFHTVLHPVNHQPCQYHHLLIASSSPTSLAFLSFHIPTAIALFQTLIWCLNHNSNLVLFKHPYGIFVLPVFTFKSLLIWNSFWCKKVNKQSQLFFF